MKFAYQKVNAKVNLTLDIVGSKEGFHELESFVSAVKIADRVLLVKRKDHIISLKNFGILATQNFTENNAYIAAKVFMETYGTYGVDIYLWKKIPLGGGLGGSSADIAAVLLAMKKLFKVDADLTVLAERLGSDVTYMLQGGNAVMRGRGENVTRVNISQKLPIIIIKNARSISSKACYQTFDQLERNYKPCTKKAVESLAEGRFYDFCKIAKNDLNDAANSFVPELDNAKDYLTKSGAYAALLTGSGSCVYGIYYNKKEQKKAYKMLKTVYEKNRIVLTSTLADK